MAARLAKQTAAVSYACHWVSLMGPVLKHKEWARMICTVAPTCENNASTTLAERSGSQRKCASAVAYWHRQPRALFHGHLCPQDSDRSQCYSIQALDRARVPCPIHAHSMLSSQSSTAHASTIVLYVHVTGNTCFANNLHVCICVMCLSVHVHM